MSFETPFTGHSAILYRPTGDSLQVLIIYNNKIYLNKNLKLERERERKREREEERERQTLGVFRLIIDGLSHLLKHL